MDARQKRLTLLFVVVVLVGTLVASATQQQPGTSAGPAPARRIVSLVPAVTEMLFAIGAGPQVVAVSSFDDFPPEVKSLPRVGALLDPDVERILTLRPDLVITYGSQGSVEAQLARAGIRTFSYRHGGVGAIVQTVRDLGSVTGRASQANGKSPRDRGAVRQRSSRGPRLRAAQGPACLRPATTIITTDVRERWRGLSQRHSRGRGGQNVFSDVRQESVQPSQETLLARAPDVIIEIRSGRSEATTDAAGERSAWSPLASIPAVRNGRIHLLTGAQFVVPGPRVGLAAEQLARMLHPEAFK